MPSELKIEQFMRIYETQLIATYPWAAHAPKRHAYLDTVRDTLSGASAKWIPDGVAFANTIAAMGIPNDTRTLMQLREVFKDGTHP